MKGVKRDTPSSYETGDILKVFPDDYVFAGKDLANGRSEVDLGEVSESEINLLTMADESINSPAAISQLPTFRSISTGRENLKILRRRKYHSDGGVKLKANAQER